MTAYYTDSKATLHITLKEIISGHLPGHPSHKQEFDSLPSRQPKAAAKHMLFPNVSCLIYILIIISYLPQSKTIAL